VILTYKCDLGTPVCLNLADKLAGNIEVDCIEFINAIPLEWRFVTSDDQALTEWKPGRREGMSAALRGFHDLQRPMRNGGTCGMKALDAILQTRGAGLSTLFVWPREGTYRAKTDPQHAHNSCSE